MEQVAGVSTMTTGLFKSGSVDSVHYGKAVRARKRVLIADDHGILRDGLRALLESEPDLEVVGDAANGREAFRMAEQLRPDLIIMDISMPLTDGPEAINHIKKRLPEVRVLVLTFHTDEQHINAALRSGADGYVLKDDSRIELIAAIRAVVAGKSFLSPVICDRVVNGYLSGGREQSGIAQPNPSGASALTSREREVIKLIAEGYRTTQIATFLSLSPKTVEKHRGNMMRKLGLGNAAAVTAYAIANGFVRP
jgi:DNA-binding NarL/FixJ family response regulator